MHLINLRLPADLMMGLPVTEDLYSIFSKEKEHEEKEKESQRGAQEQVGLLLQTYMQLLLLDDETFQGGWALINCDMRLVDGSPAKLLVQLLDPFMDQWMNREGDKLIYINTLNVNNQRKSIEV